MQTLRIRYAAYEYLRLCLKLSEYLSSADEGAWKPYEVRKMFNRYPELFSNSEQGIKDRR